MDGTRTILKIATEFKYLGTRLTSDGMLSREIGIRQHAMWEAFNKYKAVTFLNPHVSLWQKLLIYNLTVIPNATYGCAAWDYKPEHLQKLEGNQIKMLKAIMRQQDNASFSMLTAMNLATAQGWQQLVPIAAKVEAIQIKFLRHLLVTTKPNSQLHVISRCRVIPSDLESIINHESLPTISYAATIERTKNYYNLDELLYRGYVEGNYMLQYTAAKARNLPPPSPLGPMSLPIPPWHVSICNPYFTKQRLTILIKSKGIKEFISTWRRHQYQRLGQHSFEAQNNTQTLGAIVTPLLLYQESDNEISSPDFSSDLETVRITNLDTSESCDIMEYLSSSSDESDIDLCYSTPQWTRKKREFSIKPTTISTVYHDSTQSLGVRAPVVATSQEHNFHQEVPPAQSAVLDWPQGDNTATTIIEFLESQYFSTSLYKQRRQARKKAKRNN